MACDVHLHLAFEVLDAGDGDIQALAVEHLNRLGEDSRPEVTAFLSDVVTENLTFGGPKGDLLLWGTVGNYTSLSSFVNVLEPFWLDLYGNRLIFDFAHILVFYEDEHSKPGQFCEISFKDGNLTKRYDRLPFTWEQH